MTSEYEVLQGKISQVLCGSTSPFTASGYNFREFFSNADIGHFLDDIHHAIVGNKSVLRRLAAKSYQHENGFTKLTIFEDPSDRFRLRLHWWQNVNLDFDLPNVHNHRFNCISHVLRGGLRDVVWRANDAGFSYVHHRYCPRLDSEEYRLNYVGQAQLSVESVNAYRRSETYAIGHETLHSSHNLRPDTVTLFMEERSILRDHADVFSHRYPRKDLSLISPGMQIDPFIEVLSRLVSLVSEHS